MTLKTGDILQNRYRVVRLVGQGGFGAVYRAWDLSLTQPVALKENNDAGVESQRQFEREARLLAGLRHPNLPRVIDHFVLPGQGQYLVMDFVEGQSLGAMLAERGGPLDEAEVLPWMRQVCDALTYLHTRTPPVIHRDIKPDNIIVTGEGRAILVDFGISKVYDANSGTALGAQGMTPGFSPPEQYGRGKTDPRSDVYSLGATLYTLLTGSLPPDSTDLAGGVETLTPVRALNPKVSEGVLRAVEAAMVLPISQRLATAGDFAAALSAPAGAAATATVGKRVAPGAGSGRRVPALPLAIAGLVVFGLLVVVGLMLRGRGAAGDGAATATAPLVAALASPTAAPVETATETPATPTPDATASAEPTDEPRPSATPLSQIFDSRTLILPGGAEVEQVYVPSGSFTMGSASREANERPLHSVALDAFWLDRTEVTNARFAAFVADTGHVTTAERAGGGMAFATNGWEFIDGANWRQPHGPGTDIDGLDNHPVVQVSWDDAVAYCAWAGGRLPTEAEWEYAARGPDARTYPWGDGFDSTRLNYCDRNCFLEWADGVGDDGYVFTAPVGSFPDGASWVGAVDMSGNVWEWVSDWYAPDYYQVSPAANPRGPDTGELRGVRGGSWDDTYDFARSAFRYFYAPERSFNYVGFRCAHD